MSRVDVRHMKFVVSLPKSTAQGTCSKVCDLCDNSTHVSSFSYGSNPFEDSFAKALYQSHMTQFILVMLLCQLLSWIEASPIFPCQWCFIFILCAEMSTPCCFSQWFCLWLVSPFHCSCNNCIYIFLMIFGSDAGDSYGACGYHSMWNTPCFLHIPCNCAFIRP